MGGDEFDGRDVVDEFDFLYNLIAIKDVDVLGVLFSQECIILAEATDGLELIIKHDEGGELFLISVDLVDELPGEDEAVLVVEVVVLAVLEREELVVLLEGEPLQGLLVLGLGLFGGALVLAALGRL